MNLLALNSAVLTRRNADSNLANLPHCPTLYTVTFEVNYPVVFSCPLYALQSTASALRVHPSRCYDDHLAIEFPTL